MANAAVAVIGHNQPPELTPYETIKIHIDDLFETAQGFLDGDPIANQETADLVAKLLDDARKARTAAEAQRKIEAKPWDDGKAAVQALWTPLTDEKKGRCTLIADTAKKALAPWLKKLEDERIAAAEAARKEADEKAEAAKKALAETSLSDLAGRERAEDLIAATAAAYKVADRIDNGRAQAKGGARAVSLRDVWTPELSNPTDALKHYMATQPALLKAWLLGQAQADVRAGARAIPGFTIKHDRVPQ